MSQQQPTAEPRANATVWVAALGATVLIQVVGSLAVAALTRPGTTPLGETTVARGNDMLAATRWTMTQS